MSLSRWSEPQYGPKVEINIIPLVDIFMVLLVIILLASTLKPTAKESGIDMKVQLPTSSAAAAPPVQVQDFIIGVDENGKFLLSDQPVSSSTLAQALAENARMHGTKGRIVVRGDERSAHRYIVQALTLAREQGFTHLTIATRQETLRNGQGN